VPREAYGDIIPAFQKYWQTRTGQQVNILESYQGSGAQSRAIVGGFEADIAALSVEPDITRIADAGLITHQWQDNLYKGFVTDSVVVLVVRPDNPHSIKDWGDIAQSGLEVITPDPATSGGAQWNILAAYGAVRRGHVTGFDASDNGATQFLRQLITNFSVLDQDARASFLTFERGIGDVAITYENETYAGLLSGGSYQVVYPTSTILIENPVTIVDAYVDKHGTRDVAEAFVQFLWSPDAQRIFAQHGFRPVNPVVAAELKSGAQATPTADATPAPYGPEVTFLPIQDLFTIDEFGGWSAARKTFFNEGGIYPNLIAEIKGA
jgi:sulfate transport system substrate-binding protein